VTIPALKVGKKEDSPLGNGIFRKKLREKPVTKTLDCRLNR